MDSSPRLRPSATVTTRSSWRIRPIHAADDAAIAAIIRSVMSEHGAVGPGYSINDAEVDAMSASYAAQRSAFFVVEEDGRVIGGAGIAPLAGSDADTCELRKMYFLAAARGRGIGRAMLEACLGAARAHGFRRCYLETLATMTDAMRLYEAAGFRPICSPLGATGHLSCDRWYVLDL